MAEPIQLTQIDNSANRHMLADMIFLARCRKEHAGLYPSPRRWWPVLFGAALSFLVFCLAVGAWADVYKSQGESYEDKGYACFDAIDVAVDAGTRRCGGMNRVRYHPTCEEMGLGDAHCLSPRESITWAKAVCRCARTGSNWKGPWRCHVRWDCPPVPVVPEALLEPKPYTGDVQLNETAGDAFGRGARMDYLGEAPWAACWDAHQKAKQQAPPQCPDYRFSPSTTDCPDCYEAVWATCKCSPLDAANAYSGAWRCTSRWVCPTAGGDFVAE